MKRSLRVALLLLVGPCLAVRAETVIDDAGRSVTLAHVPLRIVSLAPGATEMLFAAGAGSHVVGTVEYSNDPPAARRVPRIGDSNAIDIERLVILHPDVVVVWSGGNSPAQVAKIENLHLPIYRQQVTSLAGLPQSLRRLGRLTGTEDVAAAAARDLDTRLARLRMQYAHSTPVSVLLEVWDHPVYTVGGTHIMSDALRICGARNIFGDMRDLSPTVGVEAVIARNPDLIIAAAPAVVAARWLDEWRRFGALRAVRSGNLLAFPDQRLSRLGPDILDATQGLCKVIDAARARRVNP